MRIASSLSYAMDHEATDPASFHAGGLGESPREMRGVSWCDLAGARSTVSNVAAAIGPV